MSERGDVALEHGHGTKAEREEYDRPTAIEHKHIAAIPKGEREETRAGLCSRQYPGIAGVLTRVAS